MTKSTSKLLSPQTAVESYLDNLLQEVTEADLTDHGSQISEQDIQQPEVEIGNQSIEQSSQQAITRPPESSAQEVSEQVAEKTPPQQIEIIDTPPVIESSAIVDHVTVPQMETLSKYHFPLQCLMFSVSGNQLSLPLIDMGSVVPWGSRLTPLPHSPEWFLGLLIHHEKKIRVVDTARFMHIRKMAEDVENRHILVFANDSWAITCDQLGEVIHLEEKDVKWTKKSMQGLMLGTIKSSLAIILDPEKVLLDLNQGVYSP